MFVFAVVLRTQIFGNLFTGYERFGCFWTFWRYCIHLLFYAVVLLVFSSVILAVQQLSLAADNKRGITSCIN